MLRTDRTCVPAKKMRKIWNFRVSRNRTEVRTFTSLPTRRCSSSAILALQAYWHIGWKTDGVSSHGMSNLSFPDKKWVCTVTPLVPLLIAVFNNLAISGTITNCTHGVIHITPPVKFPKISTPAKKDSLVLIFWGISTGDVIYSTI